MKRSQRLVPVAIASLIACAGPLPDDREARVLQQGFREYPPQRRDLGIEGYVVVAFTVSPLGHVSDPEVLESSPPDDEAFEKSAIEAILRWRYYPKREAGENVEHRGTALFQYCLPDAKATQRPRLELCRGYKNKNAFLSALQERYAIEE